MAATVLLAGCGGEGTPDPDDAGVRGEAAAEATTEAPPPPDGAVEPRADGEGSGPGADRAATPVDIVFLGTSLTEGWGLDDPDEDAWPARVAALAREEGHSLEIRNAGLSGETSAGALRRVGWVMEGVAPALVVLETGANDGLRALPVPELRQNLERLVAEVRAHAPDACIALVAMEAPPNLGTDYTDAFRATYGDVAREAGVELLPFLLDGVAGEPELNQEDGIHPTAEGHRQMAETVWPELGPLVARCTAG